MGRKRPSAPRPKRTLPAGVPGESGRRFPKLGIVASLTSLTLLELGACADHRPTKPVVEHTTLISTAGGIMMDPLVAARAVDGGFVVAGTTVAGVAAWAVKTDAVGNVVWRYTRGLLPEELGRSISYHVGYRGVAPMPDGSTYLCGSLVRRQDQPQPAMITHIAKDGALISESLVQPKGDPGRLFQILSCAAQGDGVVGIGATSGKTSSRFWIFASDQAGNLRWEKSFEPLPPSARSVDPGAPNDPQYIASRQLGLEPWASSVSIARTPDGLNILFCASNVNSEIIEIDGNGNILARKALSGSAAFVSASRDSPNNELYISFYSPASLHKLANIDANLNIEVTKTYSLHGLSFEGPTFVRPDRTFVVVGTANGPGSYPPPAIAHLDENLQRETHLSIEVPGNERGLPGDVAAAGEKPSTYLVAVPILRKRTADWLRMGDRRPADGAALVTINIP